MPPVLAGVGEEFVVTDDGVRLWSAGSGSGRPLVLCHGGPGSWDQLEPVAEMLHGHARVIRWDQRGAGRSDRQGPYTIARFIADMESIRRHYRIERWVVAGHSWGATLALRYAIAHPTRTDALVCISGKGLRWTTHRVKYRAERAARLGPHRDRWEQLSANTHRSPAEEREWLLINASADFGDRPAAMRLAEMWDDDRFSINYEANETLNTETNAEDDAAILAACRGLSMPAVVIHGTRDPRPIDGAAELADAMPHGSLELLPDVGHLPWAEHPERLSAVLTTFMNALSRG